METTVNSENTAVNPALAMQESIAWWLDAFAKFTEQPVLSQAAMMVRSGEWKKSLPAGDGG